jgi:predicted NAD/FAD-dependent oxidoreductase
MSTTEPMVIVGAGQCGARAAHALRENGCGAMVSPPGCRRAGADDTLAFTCELGPKSYAIIDRDGNDTTDRWAESRLLQDMIRSVWTDVQRDVQPRSP